jgi:hypothetical protein
MALCAPSQGPAELWRPDPEVRPARLEWWPVNGVVGCMMDSQRDIERPRERHGSQQRSAGGGPSGKVIETTPTASGWRLQFVVSHSQFDVMPTATGGVGANPHPPVGGKSGEDPPGGYSNTRGRVPPARRAPMLISGHDPKSQ